MEFAKLKPGDDIYMFDSDKVEYKKGTVASVPGQPRMDVNVSSGLVVDVSVNVDGNKTTYVFLSNAESAKMGSTVFATCIGPVLDAIKASKVTNQDIIDRHDSAMENVSKCDALMAQLDPERRRAVEDDARWRKLEDRLSETTSQQGALMSELKECMSQLTAAVLSLSKNQPSPSKKTQQQTTIPLIQNA
jgi:hypothetical protein